MPLLSFPEEYFKGEERNGFYIEPLMKMAWAAQLEVFAKVREVCQRHGIIVYTDFGTTLGAVRHKGYIPWDDDFDVTMFRNDAMRFIRYAKAELPEGYQVINCHDWGNYEQVIIRVTNADYIHLDEEFRREYHGFPFAAGIDIFVLDYIPDDPEQFEMMKSLLHIARACLVSHLHYDEHTDEMRDQFVNVLQDSLGVSFDREGDMVKQSAELIDSISAMYGSGESSRVAIPYRLTYLSEDCVVHPIKYYADIIEQPFEGITTVPVPIGYHELMTQEFGDYTELRCYPAHDYPFYASQMKILKNWLAEQGATLSDVNVPDIENEHPFENVHIHE